MSEKRINLKELLCDKIYLTRSPAYYIHFIKLAYLGIVLILVNILILQNDSNLLRLYFTNVINL